jgi:hypothetical protein
MNTKTHFAFRIDINDTGDSIVEHVAGAHDWAAIARWSTARIMLRQGS